MAQMMSAAVIALTIAAATVRTTGPPRSHSAPAANTSSHKIVSGTSRAGGAARSELAATPALASRPSATVNRRGLGTGQATVRAGACCGEVYVGLTISPIVGVRLQWG